jgi:hypothetical protein
MSYFEVMVTLKVTGIPLDKNALLKDAFNSEVLPEIVLLGLSLEKAFSRSLPATSILRVETVPRCELLGYFKRAKVSVFMSV